MIVLRHFSVGVLNTNSPGFIRGRRYDQNFGRLTEFKTQRQLHTGLGEVRREQAQLNRDLSRGIKPEDLKD